MKKLETDNRNIILTLTFDGLPPSINGAYYNSAKGRNLTAKAESFKTTIGWLCRAEWVDLPADKEFKLSIWFDFPAQLLERSKKADIDNRLKLLIDAIFESGGEQGADDRQIEELHVYRNKNAIVARTKVELEIIGDWVA